MNPMSQSSHELRRRENINVELNWWMKLMNEWMNVITYIPPVKPEGQAQGCFLRRAMVINPLGNDRPVKMLAFIPLLMEWELRVFDIK